MDTSSAQLTVALPQVAVGGGSTIGLGKAIALNAEGPKIKQVVIPTTCELQTELEEGRS